MGSDIAYVVLQSFLQDVNVMWQNMQSNTTPPINWMVFQTKEDLLTAYWLDPLKIPIAVIFEEPGPLNGPLKQVLKT